MRLTYLRDEFQTDSGVDGNVAANAKPHKGCDDEESRVCIAASESNSKGGGDQAGQIKSPLTSCSRDLSIGIS